MDPHDLHLELSLALHAAVAQKLSSEPELVEQARRKVAVWLAGGGSSAPLLERWNEILALALEQIAAVLTERSEEAACLRKASPFAGALDPRERERILREVRQRVESAA